MDHPAHPPRRRLLLLLAAAPLAAAAAQPAPAVRKRTKASVGYIEPSAIPNRRCGNCILYAGNGECITVESPVAIEGWCSQWTPATMG